jgi:hypothetical protein
MAMDNLGRQSLCSRDGSKPLQSGERPEQGRIVKTIFAVAALIAFFLADLAAYGMRSARSEQEWRRDACERSEPQWCEFEFQYLR